MVQTMCELLSESPHNARRTGPLNNLNSSTPIDLKEAYSGFSNDPGYSKKSILN